MNTREAWAAVRALARGEILSCSLPPEGGEADLPPARGTSPVRAPSRPPTRRRYSAVEHAERDRLERAGILLPELPPPAPPPHLRGAPGVSRPDLAAKLFELPPIAEPTAPPRDPYTSDAAEECREMRRLQRRIERLAERHPEPEEPTTWRERLAARGEELILTVSIPRNQEDPS